MTISPLCCHDLRFLLGFSNDSLILTWIVATISTGRTEGCDEGGNALQTLHRLWQSCLSFWGYEPIVIPETWRHKFSMWRVDICACLVGPSQAEDRWHQQGPNTTNHKSHSHPKEQRTGIVSRVQTWLTTETAH